MNVDINKLVTTLTAIFTIVIISCTGVQGIMNDKIRKQLINHPFIKHIILIVSIYTTKTYEMIKLSKNDDEKNLLLNLFKSVIIWAFLLLLFKIDINYLLIIIGFVIGNKALSETVTDNKLKDILSNVSRYGIIIVYFFGVYKYLLKNRGRDKKSILYSILKTID